MATKTYFSRDSATGTPEDADTATLGDATNTYGIRRRRDNAVIVAPGASLTNEAGDGQYSYDWGGAGLDPAETLGYDISAKFVKGAFTTYALGFISAIATGRSLRQLLKDLAAALGGLTLETTTALGADASTITSSALIDNDTQPDETSKYRGEYALFFTGTLAGEQSRVKRNGFTASGGTLSVTRPFSAPTPNAAEFGLSPKLPWFRMDRAAGLRDCINAALKVTHHPQRVEVAAISAQENYALVTWPWLTDEDQIGQLFDPNTTATLNPATRLPSARIRFDADVSRLEIPAGAGYTTGDTFQVEAQVPNFNFLKTGGAWQFSSVGLQALDDETLGDAVLIVECALVYAYRELARITDPREGKAEYTAQAIDQEQRAIRIRRARQPKIGSTGYGSSEERAGWTPNPVYSFGSGDWNPPYPGYPWR